MRRKSTAGSSSMTIRRILPRAQLFRYVTRDRAGFYERQTNHGEVREKGKNKIRDILDLISALNRGTICLFKSSSVS